MTQSNHLPPPPPPPTNAIAAVPPGFYRASDGNVYPIQPAAAAPPPPPPQPVAAALPPPPPAFAPAPYAAPAAVPQGFAPSAFPQSDLNAVGVRGETLFPQVQGIYDLKMVAFSKRKGASSGFAYWIGFEVLSSTSPEVMVGATFSFLCKVAMTDKDTAGDQRRKAILAAAYGQDPNAAINWNALSDQTETRHLQSQPLFLQARLTTSNRPMLDPKTFQPTGKNWCNETFLRAVTGPAA